MKGFDLFMTSGQIPLTDEDHVTELKAAEQPLSGPTRGSAAAFEVKNTLTIDYKLFPFALKYIILTIHAILRRFWTE